MGNKSIFNKFAPKALAAYIQELAKQEEQDYILRSYFPTEYTAELSLSYLRASAALPAALRPTAFDAEPSLRPRRGFKEVVKGIPFFREAFFVGEEEYKELMAINNGEKSERYAVQIVNQYYEDGQNLHKGALMQVEAMRMQLLSKGGKIEVGDGAAMYSYDFEMPSANLFAVAPGFEWSNTATAEIIRDLRRWREDMRSGPGRTLPGAVIMSTKTWGYIMDNQPIAQAIWAERGFAPGSELTAAQIREYINRKLDTGAVGYRPLEFIVVDNGYYPHLDSVFVPYFEDNKVAFIPGNIPLGKTFWSDTPEYDAGGSSLNTGKFTMSRTAEYGITICQSLPDLPPMNIRTWLSMIAMPSFPQVDKCGLAIVA